MPLNTSGPLSFGGSIVGQSINLELGVSATATASINSTAFRTLAGVPSGQISLSNFYGKSNAYTTLTETLGTTFGGQTGATVRIDTNRFLVVVSNPSGKSGLFTTAAVVDVSGTTMTKYGNTTLLSFEPQRRVAGLVAYSNTHVLYMDYIGELRLIKITGTTVNGFVGGSIGPSTAQSTYGNMGEASSSTTVVVSNNDWVNESVGARIITRSGDSISGGVSNRWGGVGFTGSPGIGAAYFTSASNGIVLFRKEMFPFTISGTETTVSPGNGYQTLNTPNATAYGGLSKLANGNYVGIVNSYNPNANATYAYVVTQSGTTITRHTGTTFSNTSSSSQFAPSFAPFNSSTAALGTGTTGADYAGYNISGTTVSSVRTAGGSSRNYLITMAGVNERQWIGTTTSNLQLITLS